MWIFKLCSTVNQNEQVAAQYLLWKSKISNVMSLSKQFKGVIDILQFNIVIDVYTYDMHIIAYIFNHSCYQYYLR